MATTFRSEHCNRCLPHEAHAQILRCGQASHRDRMTSEARSEGRDRVLAIKLIVDLVVARDRTAFPSALVEAMVRTFSRKVAPMERRRRMTSPRFIPPGAESFLFHIVGMRFRIYRPPVHLKHFSRADDRLAPPDTLLPVCSRRHFLRSRRSTIGSVFRYTAVKSSRSITMPSSTPSSPSALTRTRLAWFSFCLASVGSNHRSRLISGTIVHFLFRWGHSNGIVLL